jgi:hypothetical protein
MKALGGFLGIALGLWIAGGLQQALSGRMGIWSAHPDFFLVALASGALFASRAQAALLGFFCGLLHGALAGANLSHYVVSRTVAGFLGGWIRSTSLETNAWLAFGMGFLVTVASRLLFMFLAPPPQLLPFLQATILAAAYNGLLVLPVYLLFRKFAPPRGL